MCLIRQTQKLFLNIYLKDRTKLIFFFPHDPVSVTSRYKNFIPIKQNGNCYAALAIDVLRNPSQRTGKTPMKVVMFYSS
jgi:hypothetical protein